MRTSQTTSFCCALWQKTHIIYHEINCNIFSLELVLLREHFWELEESFFLLRCVFRMSFCNRLHYLLKLIIKHLYLIFLFWHHSFNFYVTFFKVPQQPNEVIKFHHLFSFVDVHLQTAILKNWEAMWALELLILVPYIVDCWERRLHYLNSFQLVILRLLH